MIWNNMLRLTFRMTALCAFAIVVNFDTMHVAGDPGLQDLVKTISSVVKAGSSLTGTTTKALAASGCNRNVVIEISNHMEQAIYGGDHFLQWGWNTVPPQPIIRAETREAAKFEKVCDTATGTSGVLTYRIGDEADPATIAIIFSVPYNYIHASNWYGLKFMSSKRSVDKQLYDDMYGDSAWSSPQIDRKYAYAYQGKPIVIFHKDYIVAAQMSNLGRSILKVNVMKKEGGHAQNNRFFQRK